MNARCRASLALALCGAHAFLSAPAAGWMGSRSLGACTHGRRDLVVCGARRGAAATATPRACGAGGVKGLRASGMDDVYLDRYVDHDTRQRAGMRR